jgi:hypothetical protein
MVLTHRDLTKLFDGCLNSAHVPFGIFHGISNNRFKRLDISDTQALLGYTPEDDSFSLAGHPEVKKHF